MPPIDAGKKKLGFSVPSGEHAASRKQGNRKAAVSAEGRDSSRAARYAALDPSEVMWSKHNEVRELLKKAGDGRGGDRDAEDRVKYFSQSRDRIFVRATSVIGRSVQNCHPPQSVRIPYFAVRNPQGKYLGTLEVTQDITEMQALSGEHRLLDDGE